MSIKFTVLLYSKYSTSSSKIISIINQYQNIFIENFNIKLLCIDNENVRKRILESKKISITFVPSILVIYNDGGVEKYENNDAFNWVNEIIQRVVTLQQEQKNMYQQSSNKIESLGQEIDFEDNQDNEDNEDNQDNDVLEKVTQVQKKQAPIKAKNQDSNSSSSSSSNSKSNSNSKTKKQEENNKNKTLIEDLEDVEDLEVVKDLEENNTHDIKQVESKNALSIKRNDLLSLASEMQKNRDTFVETTDRPKLSLNR